MLDSNRAQADARPTGPKYYASIIGPDGKEMRVLVIPVKIRNCQRYIKRYYVIQPRIPRL